METIFPRDSVKGVKQWILLIKKGNLFNVCFIKYNNYYGLSVARV